jgi:hypothetical protein
MSHRSEALAVRLEQGAAALAAYAESLTDAEWKLPMKEGRTVGVVVHHVGNMYPIEIQLAQALANGDAITGLTWNDVAKVNAGHAHDQADVDKATAIRFLKENSAKAAAAVRTITDEQLDRANQVSLNSDAPLTCQFFIEDHALRHSYHHLARIKETVEAARAGVGATR